ncbi:conjugal transfer protein TraN, partial [Salmonella enterica]|nr:conjugal transfer protein TraN [Salmonella enterica]
MRTRYIMSALQLTLTLTLACGTAMAADNASDTGASAGTGAGAGGWRQARVPQTADKQSGSAASASTSPRAGDVPATQVQGTLPSPDVNTPLVQEAARLDSELSPDEIRSLRGIMSENERAISAPVTSVVPRISTLTVSLSPGASLPLVRTAMNNLSVVTFTDINGTPWSQSDPPYNPAPRLFDVQYNANMVTITPLRPWVSGNVSVYLKGLSVPVILNVTSGETDTRTTSQEMDSRLDLRIPREGPGSSVLATPEDKIALHDRTLQAFLDGVPP